MSIDSKNRSFIFWKWVNDLDPFFLDCDAKNTFCQIWLEWNFLLANMTQRIELLSMTQILFFQKKKRLTEFNLYSTNMTKELAFFSWIWRKELNPLFLEYDAQNLTLYFQICLELNFFSKNWTLYFLIRLKVLNFSF